MFQLNIQYIHVKTIIMILAASNILQKKIDENFTDSKVI